MLSTNHCVILCSGLYPRWRYSLKHRVFSLTASVLVCKRQRNCNVHILVANCNINNAAGILFSESMSEPHGFFACFCGCNVEDDLRLVAQGPPSGRRLPSEFWYCSWSSSQQITCPVYVLLPNFCLVIRYVKVQITTDVSATYSASTFRI